MLAKYQIYARNTMKIRINEQNAAENTPAPSLFTATIAREIQRLRDSEEVSVKEATDLLL